MSKLVAMHGRDHRVGGADEIPGLASPLEVTDGTTTVTDVATLNFLSGAVVGSPGGGVADVSIPEITTNIETVVVSAFSVAANTNPSLSFSHSAGATLLGYSTPTAPTFVSRGLYALVGNVTLGGTGTNNVIYSGAVAFVSSTYGNPAANGSITGGSAGHAATAIDIPLTVVGLAALGDTIVGAVTNLDTIAWNFSAQFTLAQLFSF